MVGSDDKAAAYQIGGHIVSITSSSNNNTAMIVGTDMILL